MMHHLLVGWGELDDDDDMQLVQLSQVVEAVQVVIWLDLPFIIEKVPRVDDIEAMPQVVVRRRIDPVELEAMDAALKVRGVRPTSIIDDGMLA